MSTSTPADPYQVPPDLEAPKAPTPAQRRAEKARRKLVLDRTMRVLSGLAGVALLITGTLATFWTQNAGGSAALVAGGIVLLALGLFADRITGVEAAGVKVQLEQAAKAVNRAADEVAAAGKPDVAQDLRATAQGMLPMRSRP